jgi:hypothetical protein
LGSFGYRLNPLASRGGLSKEKFHLSFSDDISFDSLHFSQFSSTPSGLNKKVNPLGLRGVSSGVGFISPINGYGTKDSRIEGVLGNIGSSILVGDNHVVNGSGVSVEMNDIGIIKESPRGLEGGTLKRVQGVSSEG